MDPLVHRRLPLVRPLHVEQLHQRLNRHALQEHREVNHSNCRRHKDRLRLHVQRIYEQHEGKGHRPSQATVGHYKLVHVRQLVYPEAIRNVRQQDDAQGAEHGAKEYRQHDEPNVPLVVRFNRRHAQEHENNGLRGAGQHLQRVFYCRVRFVRNVGLHVVLHCDAAEGDTGGQDGTQFPVEDQAIQKDFQ